MLHFINIHKHCGIETPVERCQKLFKSTSLPLSSVHSLIFLIVLFWFSCYFRFVVFLVVHSASIECLFTRTLCDINSANIDLCSCFDFVLFSAHSHITNGHRKVWSSLYCDMFTLQVDLICSVGQFGVEHGFSRFFCTTTSGQPNQWLDLYAKIPLLFKTHLHQFMK